VSDYFTVFGLPRKLGVDGGPCSGASTSCRGSTIPISPGVDAERQAEVLDQSALVNRAYRALREPLARVEYLIALERVARSGRARPPSRRRPGSSWKR